MYDGSAITERLFCGGLIISQEDVDELRHLGVTHIIDCQNEHNDPSSGFAKSFALLVTPRLRSSLRPGFAIRTPRDVSGGFGYLWDPADDDGLPKPAEWFERGVDFALGALAHPGYSVLCHCAAGINRGPSMCYAIMRALGWDSASALQRLRAMRPQVNIAYRRDAEQALVQLGWTRIVEPT